MRWLAMLPCVKKQEWFPSSSRKCSWTAGILWSRCYDVTEEVFANGFSQLYIQRVMLEGMILKPNMVLPGLICPTQETVDEVTDATVGCLLRAVPAAVGGLCSCRAANPVTGLGRLNAMNVRFKSRLPWALAFSFARAIQQPALEIWHGEEANVPRTASSVSSDQVQSGCASWRI